jgi:hypothetical protein
LFLIDTLHAKYYRIRPYVFVGSANLTGAAFGWSPAPNLEILCRLDYTDEWEHFEQALGTFAVRATRSIRDAVDAASKALPPVAPWLPEQVSSNAINPEPVGTWHNWFPNARSPESLFECYLDRIDLVSIGEMQSARVDLAYLQPPAALTRPGFYLWVRSRLAQQPYFQALDRLIADSPRFGELKRRISFAFPDLLRGVDLTQATQNLMRWSTHFFPERYCIRVYRFTEHLELVVR